MTHPAESDTRRGIRRARELFPATENLAYFNTAAVGLASRALIDAYRHFADEWTTAALDFAACEAAAEHARAPSRT